MPLQHKSLKRHLQNTEETHEQRDLAEIKRKASLDLQ